MIFKYAFSENNGFSLHGKVLRLSRHGTTEKEVPFEGDFDKLYSSMKAVELFPDRKFSLSGELEVVQAAAEVTSVTDGIRGRIKVNGVNGSWEALRSKHKVFEAKVNARTWVDDEPGSGWEIFLPQIYLELDPVIVKRIACMIEELVYQLAKAETDRPTVSREIRNTFSVEDPTWAVSLPVVRKLGEM